MTGNEKGSIATSSKLLLQADWKSKVRNLGKGNVSCLLLRMFRVSLTRELSPNPNFTN